MSNAKRKRDPNEEEEEEVEIDVNVDRWSRLSDLLFLDLDNYSHFFEHLREDLPPSTAVLVFQRMNNHWKQPIKNPFWLNLVRSDRIHLMRRSGSRHDASDFALVLTLGQLHCVVPRCVSFTMISGDRGFLEVLHQLRRSERKINWFNPHQISLLYLNQILHQTNQGRIISQGDKRFTSLTL